MMDFIFKWHVASDFKLLTFFPLKMLFTIVEPQIYRVYYVLTKKKKLLSNFKSVQTTHPSKKINITKNIYLEKKTLMNFSVAKFNKRWHLRSRVWRFRSFKVTKSTKHAINFEANTKSTWF